MKVRVYIRCRLADGTHPFLEPVTAGNNKLKPLYALVNGVQERHPEGSYYLRYMRNGKRVWELVGPDPSAAITAAKRRELYARDPAAVPDPMPEALGGGRDLRGAAAEYLYEVGVAKAHRTFLAYSHAINGFVDACESTSIEAVNRKDVLAYIGALREGGVTDRTIANRLMYLKTFLLHFEQKWPLLKTDRVKYTEKTVEAYNSEELQRLFAATDQEETELFQFLLCTGVREQEAMYATWRDVDFQRKKFKVSEKNDFTPKDREEGSIPIPDSLVSLLQARRKRYPNTRLIFGRPAGKANGHFLRMLKQIAYRAGLNCRECINRAGECCSTSATCHQWGLHRFRKTFATMHHEAGASARTIQRWLRHSSLDTTLRYLAGSDDQSERVRAQVNSTFAGLSVHQSPFPIDVQQKEVA